MAYEWISITGVRFSTNLGGRIDLYPCHFSFAWVFSGLQRVQRVWAWCRAAGISRYLVWLSLFLLFFKWRKCLEFFFCEYQKVSPGQDGTVSRGGRRLSTKTLREPRRRRFMTLRYPMGNGIRGHKTPAFWGKQKNFNIFSFPESLDVDTVFLAWRERDGRA
jgi:hypothetical protein